MQIVQKGDGIIMAEFETVSIAVWRKDSVMARFLVQRQALVDLAVRYPGKAGFFCIVEPTSAPPGDDVRKATSRMFDDLSSKLSAVAMIIEGTGFRAAIVRSVASGIVMLGGKRTIPMSYMATVREGASWIGRHVQLSSEAALVDAVEQARAAFDS